MKKKIEALESSGNVFQDLAFRNPEAALAKAELARQIYNTIKSQKLTQVKAAEMMGVDQAKVSEIITGKLSKYTIDRLLRYLLKLGRDVEIRVKKHTSRSEPPSLQVVGIKSNLPKKRLSA